MDLRLEVSERNGWSVVEVGGEIDVATAPRLREQLITLVNDQRYQIVVSLEAVDFIDSTGLGVLTYAACNAVLLHPGFRPGVFELMRRAGGDTPPVEGPRTLLGSEGVEHQQLRRVVAPWFTPRRIEELRARTAAYVDELLDDGMPIVPGGDHDIADADAIELGYVATPVAAARSFHVDGLALVAGRYGELPMPMRLFTSRQDHVIDPAHSHHLARTYGGPVEHTWLERSFHVATQDLDRELLADEIVAFALRVTAP